MVSLKSGPSIFEASIERLQEYRRLELKNNGYIGLPEAEILHKLTQLHRILLSIDIIIRKIHFQQKFGNSINSSRLIDDLEIYTETFYHFAWRIIEITKKNSRLRSIKRCGIADVRNNLIQHPEGQIKEGIDKRDMMFSVGSIEIGPKIKSYDTPQNSINDAGLFVNAIEFDIELSKTIDRLFQDIQA